MYASFVGSDSAGATYSSRLLAIRKRPCKTPSACVTGEVMNFSDSNSGAGYVQTQYHALRYSGNGPSIQAAPCLGSPMRFYSYASHVGRRSWRRRRPRGHHARCMRIAAQAQKSSRPLERPCWDWRIGATSVALMLPRDVDGKDEVRFCVGSVRPPSDARLPRSQRKGHKQQRHRQTRRPARHRPAACPTKASPAAWPRW